jgi:hypothetical protein
VPLGQTIEQLGGDREKFDGLLINLKPLVAKLTHKSTST